MVYCGIDYHKKYSVVSMINENGQTLEERRIGHQNPALFEELLNGLDQPVKVVFENSLNWSWLYEILERIQNVKQIILANPYKVKLISEAQIKTDKIDAGKLAHLLRLDVIPACHVPSRKMRERKEVLRQRIFWVRDGIGGLGLRLSSDELYDPFSLAGAPEAAPNDRTYGEPRNESAKNTGRYQYESFLRSGHPIRCPDWMAMRTCSTVVRN